MDEDGRIYIIVMTLNSWNFKQLYAQIYILVDYAKLSIDLATENLFSVYLSLWKAKN